MNLKDVFATVLNVPAAELDEASGPKVLGSWTSRAHIQLITTMEQIFGVTFSAAEIKSLKCLGDARGFLRQKGVEA